MAEAFVSGSGFLFAELRIFVLELVDTTSGIDEFGFTSVKRVGRAGDLEFYNRILNAFMNDCLSCVSG